MTEQTPPDADTPASERFERAIAAIDAANADDPHRIEVDGVARPKELTHARMLGEWVRRLAPAPSEELLLAAHAHHVRRWTMPRDSYPAGRQGYLRWRRDLHAFHAEEAARLLRDAGYDEPTIGRIQEIVRKQRLTRNPATTDPEVQTLEDGLNLVFLETQFDELIARLDDDAKMAEIVAKTWRKMSERGHEAALTIAYGERARAIIERALRGAEGS
jgi:hypothetical protein